VAVAVVPLLVVHPHQLTLTRVGQVAVAPVRSSQVVFPQVLPVPVGKVPRVLVVIAALVTLTPNPVAAGAVVKRAVHLVYMAAVLVVTEPQAQSLAPRSHALAAVVVVSARRVQVAQVAQEEAAMAVQMLMALMARSTLVAVVVVAVLAAQMPYVQAARVVLA
jgi:hypothetical protein